MKKFDNQTFEKQQFVLEETMFFNCVLKRCDLFYSGGDFLLKDSQLQECQFFFLGAAKNTRLLFQTLGMLKPEPSQRQRKLSMTTIQ